MNKTTLTPYYYIAAILTGLVFVVAPAMQIFAGHNGAEVSHNIGECGETTFTASITDPEGTHKVDNMHLVVYDGDDTYSKVIPTDGSGAEITVGPFEEDTTIKWRVFGGGERDYDDPLWTDHGEPGFGSSIETYANEEHGGSYDWTIGGSDENNPFLNWNEVEVDGCEPPQKVDICHWNNGNGYNFQNVNENSITGNGNNHGEHEFDIIPPFGDGEFAGHNWDDWENGEPEGFEGTDPQEVYESDCVKPEPTGEITGEKQNWNTEEGLSGWTINLYNSDEEIVTSTTTTQNGSYAFTGLADGTYTVCEEDRGGWNQKEPTEGPECPNGTTGHEVVIDGGSVVSENDFWNEEAQTQCTVTIVSDETNTVVEKDGDNAKLLTFIHSAWTAVISGADWIWGDDPVADPEVEETQTFEKKFGWNGPVMSATLEVASDNTHSFDLNGEENGDSAENNFQTGTQDSYDVSSAIQQGNNILSVAVTNEKVEGSTPKSNPAGLRYKLTITGSDEECGIPYEEPQEPEEEPWCSFEGEVIDHSPDEGDERAEQNDGDPVDPARRDVGSVEDGPASYANFGGSEANDWSTDDFYSLGIGGFLVYEFTGQVAFDQPGDDIAIYEITGGNSGTDEKAEVFVSQNGSDWESLGVHTGDMSLDISGTGLDFVKFVKLVDKSEGVQGNNGDGYDVDAIVILQGSCGDKPAVQCEIGKELLENGGFENPVVAHNAQWDIFELGHAGLGWAVKWFGGDTTHGDAERPELGQMELQKDGLQGWLAASGSEQWTELDADWFGPDNPHNGEPGAVSISQTVGTEVGETYTFSFDFSPRPNTSEDQNKVEVLANGSLIGTVGPDATAGNQTEWSSHAFDFVATTTETTFALRDAGTPNDSLGTFIDNASLMCTEPEEPKDTITVEKWNDENGNGEQDNEEEGLSGWKMVVKPQSLEPVQILEIDSSDHEATITNVLSSDRTYLIEVEGTWENSGQSGREVDAEYFADDNWSTPQDLEDMEDRDPRQLDLVINNANVDWGSYNDAHLYKTVMTGDDATLDIRVFDEDNDNNKPSWYEDNIGTLAVRIYDVTDYIETTSEGGIVEVDVDPGEYQIVEIMQDGWIQTAPQGPSYCHIDTTQVDNPTCAFGNVEEDAGDDNGGDNGGGDDGNGDDEKTQRTEIITKDTAAGENQKGWLFNRDQTTKTPFAFIQGNPSIGDGSLKVEPIGNSQGSDKFIGEYFLLTQVADVENISYDFMIDDSEGAGPSDENEFYMNVYANFGTSSPTNFYDCRYDVVPSIGSITDYTTVTFDPTQSYPVTERVSSPHTCPSVPADMDDEDAGGSTIRMFALNVGDTSLNDAGVGGYLDKVVVSTSTEIVTFDFEGQIPTETTITNADDLEDNPTQVGDPFTVQWEVVPSTGSSTPTGTVEVKVNGGSGGCSAAATAGECDIDSPTTDSPATVMLKAFYTGDTGFIDSSSSDVEHEIIEDQEEGGGGDNNENNDNNNNQTQSGGGVGGGGIIGGPNSFGFQNSNPGGSIGQVLGATTGPGEQTQCVPEYLTQYLRLGSTGDQVRLLQAFLNGHINAGLSITGTFGQQTHEAVEEFQSMYVSEILTPWGINQPTGYVYYTTQKKINELACGDRMFPLTQAQLNEIERIRNRVNQNPGQTPSGPIGETTQQEENQEEGKENTELTQEDTQQEDQVASVGEGTEQNRGVWSRIWNFFFSN